MSETAPSTAGASTTTDVSLLRAWSRATFEPCEGTDHEMPLVYCKKKPEEAHHAVFEYGTFTRTEGTGAPEEKGGWLISLGRGPEATEDLEREWQTAGSIIGVSGEYDDNDDRCMVYAGVFLAPLCDGYCSKKRGTLEALTEKGLSQLVFVNASGRYETFLSSTKTSGPAAGTSSS